MSVNINKIATLRNARGGGLPDLLQVAKDCEQFGADGITVHPRPDERHITLNDVYAIAPVLKTPFNIEGYPDGRFMQIVRDIRPHQATLVPDTPDVLTSEKGWDTVGQLSFLKEIVAEIQRFGVKTSLFVEPRVDVVEGAAAIGTESIELYTGPYAQQYSTDRSAAIQPYRAAAQRAAALGLEVNAGHDLNRENLAFLMRELPRLAEVSIGHALISDALYFGLEKTIGLYKKQMSL